MKVLTWNINGIRASKVDLKKLFDSLDADVICLQETKVTRDQLDEPSAIVEGYNSYFSFSRKRSGYSGVANFCRNSATPVAAEEGLSGLLTIKNDKGVIGCYGDHSSFTREELESLDAEGRTVITQHRIRTNSGEEKDLVIINVYCPRADPEREDRLLYKLRFYALLQTRAEALLQKGYHVIVVGDINTIHKRQDTADVDQLEEVVRRPSRVWLNQFVWEQQRDDIIDAVDNHEEFAAVTTETVGGQFVDTFRYLHPDKPEAFTNWCTLTAARATNYGRRLDFIFADIDLTTAYVTDSEILAHVEGSDHCPVITGLSCSCLSAQSCPPFCTKFMPEFSGKQTKLSTFFIKKQAPSSNISHDTAKGEKVPESTTNQSEKKITIFNSTCSGGTKRTQNTAVHPAGKRKKMDSKSTSLGSKQSSLVNFFGKKTEVVKQTHLEATLTLGNCSAGAPEKKYVETSLVITNKTGNGDTHSNGSNTSSNSKTLSCPSRVKEADGKTAASAWKSLLKGLGPVPLCKGHNEPCVLRMVKKPGPNKGKQFYVCNRGEGLKTNPEARCDFFKWIDTKK